MTDTMHDSGAPDAPATAPGGGLGQADKDARMWGMFLHLSMLGGFVVPLLGFIAPIIIWQVKKDEIPSLDAHGKNATNWIISSVIYSIVCAILMIVLVGIFLMMALGLLCIIFPVIAGIKANNGEVWKYPGAIPILK